MWHCGSVCDIAVSMYLGHPAHLLTYFSWESLSRHSNQMVESIILWPGVIKIWIQQSDSYLHQSLHGAILFVAFRNHIRSHTCGITLIHLHVFHFLSHSDSHTAYMESRLKTIHHLFKRCRWLKTVFIAVYWPSVLCNLKFYLYIESRLHWISISYQTLPYLLIFIANTCLCVGMWNIADLKINENFWLGENLLGKWKHLLGKCIYRGNWIEKKIISGHDSLFHYGLSLDCVSGVNSAEAKQSSEYKVNQRPNTKISNILGKKWSGKFGKLYVNSDFHEI